MAGSTVGSQPVQGTPSRDRDRHPFPQSAQPSPAPSSRQVTSSSASNSYTHLPLSSSPSPSVQAPPQIITVEALLKQHAAALDPTSAALEFAVNDRNVFTAQNAQLWKLVEKQRTGYNQILKELERIRGERDVYKNRLITLNGGQNTPSDKRHRATSDRKQSLDTSSSRTGSMSTIPQIKNPQARHNSEDTVSRNLSQPTHLHASRSCDPLVGRTSDNGLQSNANYSLANAISSETPHPTPLLSMPAPSLIHASQGSRPSPLPLVVPPRSNVVPSSPAVSNSPDSPSSRHPMSGDTNTMTNNPAGNGTHLSSVATRPFLYPRKSSLADSFSSAATSSSISSSASSTPSSQIPDFAINLLSSPHTPQQQQYQAGDSTQSNSQFNPLDNNYRQRTSSSTITSTSPPPIITTPAAAASPPSIQPLPQPHMLAAIAESRPQFLSRDSRISLPEEARHYIANMADSPVASARVDAFSPRSKFSASVFTPPPNMITGSVHEGEFLDMDEEEEEDGPMGASTGDQGNAHHIIQCEGDEKNKGSYITSQPPDSQIASSSRTMTIGENTDTRRREKARVVAEEFPLPPPSNIFIQRQAIVAQEAQTYARGTQHQTPRQEQNMTSQLSPQGKQPQAMAEQPGGYTDLPHPRSQENTFHARQQTSHRPDSHPQQSQDQQQPGPASFRALPLLSSDLPHTNITVSHSFVRPNDRGKEVLSFIVFVDPGNGKDGWKVEKLYSDVLGLDQRVRSSVGKGVGKKIANLPEGKLWKDHAPAKVDQRKVVLENYLQTLIHLPVKNNDEVIAFFTSDIVRDLKQAVMQAGHKEGYLTKRGKNFGGWKTRFFVLQGPVLEYYDCRGGAQLGSITITGAQIARQHRTERPPSSDDEKEYRHAFLIVEAKKGPGGNHPRHVLCAESDEDRDSWVEMLVRYYTGTYSEELVFNPSSGLTSIQNNLLATSSQQSGAIGQPRPSPNDVPNSSSSTLYPSEDHTRPSSPSKPPRESLPTDRQGISFGGGIDSHMRVVDRSLGLPSSLPDSSPLSSTPVSHSDTNTTGQRANSELGHYSDLQDNRSGNVARPNQRQISPERHRNRDAHDGRKTFYPSLGTVAPAPTMAVPPPVPPERVPSPEKLDVNGKVKISGPMNGAPIPSGFKFGGKEVSSSDATVAASERREKAKSRSFWGFGKTSGDKSQPHTIHVPRAVFGVPLEEALDVAQMCNLPAIVFRSIQYLEVKKADQEEGIYRLSGSSAVIKSLRDRFNNEGDVDLLASDEYWDPHAIAGLLKSFLRELPASILSRELHLRFLSVIDFMDAQERIRELSHLIAALPLANYSLLRALTAHLILVVQNSNVNKMTMRNVGIVFSPTLGIPAGVFSLMLGEFNRVFNVDADHDDIGGEEDGNGRLLQHSLEPLRRNSRQYSDAAADQLLGLSGRSLSTPAEETQSDCDDYSIQEESGPETTEDATAESFSSSSPISGFRGSSAEEIPDTPTARASGEATSRGLKVTVTHSERGNRHSKLMGLPTSPRPTTASEEVMSTTPAD